MNNDTLTSMDNQQSLSNEQPLTDSINTKIKAGLALLKPSILNIFTTFITFLLSIVLLRKIGLAALFAAIAYLLVAFFVQPFFSEKLNKEFLSLNLKGTKAVPSFLPTTSNSIILMKQEQQLVAIALLKITLTADYLPLGKIWDFLEQEGIQIQDCLEGVHLIIRKTTKIKWKKPLQEAALQLQTKVQRTVTLTMKKFDLYFSDSNIQLVNHPEKMRDILYFGLAHDKFMSNREMSEEELEYIRRSPFTNLNHQTQEMNSEEIDPINN
jgi:hypothetical protein